MAASRVVGLLFEAWKELDWATANLDRDAALHRDDGESSIAWSLAHVTNQIDALINVRFLQLEPHALIGHDRFRRDGSGEADDWGAIQRGVAEVRAAARAFLTPLRSADLDQTLPYDGSLVAIRPYGLRLEYALLRIAAHHYLHAGEIAALRRRRGDNLGDSGLFFEECL